MKPTSIHVTDEKEFAAVYERYQNVVLKSACDILHDYHMAQDVCQETFLRLGFYFDDMPRKKRKPWLRVVAINYARDLLRKGGKYHMSLGLPETSEWLAEDVLDRHLKKIATREFTVTVLRALREKKILWYEILVLVECLGISKKRVAQEYEISVAALDGYLRRAKEWIRNDFREEYGEH